MTWIVGTLTMFGYRIGISDIRVTLADGLERNCLQNIYPIFQWIALGFACSVAIGFAMVSTMRRWLDCDKPDHAWKRLETVELWPQIAKNIFAAAPSEEQAGQCAPSRLCHAHYSINQRACSPCHRSAPHCPARCRLSQWRPERIRLAASRTGLEPG